MFLPRGDWPHGVNKGGGEEMPRQGCDFCTANLKDFNGCPGLDVEGDDDDCRDCEFRLFNIKNDLLLLREIQRLIKEA